MMIVEQELTRNHFLWRFEQKDSIIASSSLTSIVFFSPCSEFSLTFDRPIPRHLPKRQEQCV